MVTIPIVHLNGTSRQQLIDIHIQAYRDVSTAIGSLRKTIPNGRDFYPQGDSALSAAMHEHAIRISKLTDVGNELEAILLKLTEA